MKLTFTSVLAALILLFAFNQTNGQIKFIDTMITQKSINLMPIPAKGAYSSKKLYIDSTFTVAVMAKGANNLYDYTTRFVRRVANNTGLFLTQDVITEKSNNPNAIMQIHIIEIGEVKLGTDESYSLEINEKGIVLKAKTDIGAMRGLETVYQLLRSDEKGFSFMMCHIEDNPRFAWRGLMIDACRHFMPIDMVKRNIDLMAAVKLNVLHWHLSEDQGFRVECKTFPKLHELGSDGLYYTQEEVKSIVKYAAARGIRVVPEFDLPGHATSWFVGYPQYASAPGPYTIEREWGVFDPTFNPTLPETYEFLDKFFAEITTLFPDPYFHIGGDENNGKQWKNNEQIKDFMKQNNIPDNHHLQGYFSEKLINILSKYGKRVIGWDEILQDALPKSSVIHSWRGPKGLEEAAKKGYQVILSNGYYIDLMQSAESHYLNDPLPEKNNLSASEKEMILGGEATMWAEMVTPENVDSRIWPRTAAIAERLWSPINVNDVDDMYRRLAKIDQVLDDLGSLHIRNRDGILRRLTKGDDITPLKLFCELIEPVKEYRRHSQGKKYYSYSPYTRVVDAATADSKAAIELNRLVKEYSLLLKTKPLHEIKAVLNQYKDILPKLEAIGRKNSSINEVLPLAITANRLIYIGLEATELLTKNERGTDAWYNDALEIIKQSEIPKGQTSIAINKAISKLVELAHQEIK